MNCVLFVLEVLQSGQPSVYELSHVSIYCLLDLDLDIFNIIRIEIWVEVEALDKSIYFCLFGYE